MYGGFQPPPLGPPPPFGGPPRSSLPLQRPPPSFRAPPVPSEHASPAIGVDVPRCELPGFGRGVTLPPLGRGFMTMPVGEQGKAGGASKKSTSGISLIRVFDGTGWEQHANVDAVRRGAVQESKAVYYYHRSTGRTTWDKPWDILTPLERVDPRHRYRECVSNGRKYWFDELMSESLWKKPEALSQAEERKGTLVSESGGVPSHVVVRIMTNGTLWGERIDISEDKKTVEKKGTNATKDPETGGDIRGDSAAHPMADSEEELDPEIARARRLRGKELSMKEASNAFMELLKDAHIPAHTEWKEAQLLIRDDPRYKALRNNNMRKSIYLKWASSAQDVDLERRSAVVLQLRAGFREMLVDSDIDLHARFSDVKAQMEADRRYQDCFRHFLAQRQSSESAALADVKGLFYKLTDTIVREREAAKKAEEKRHGEGFKALLQELSGREQPLWSVQWATPKDDLPHQWKSKRGSVCEIQEVKDSHHFKALGFHTAKRYFQELVDELWEADAEKRKQAARLQRAEKRGARTRFRTLIKDMMLVGHLSTDSSLSDLKSLLSRKHDAERKTAHLQCVQAYQEGVKPSHRSMGHLFKAFMSTHIAAIRPFRKVFTAAVRAIHRAQIRQKLLIPIASGQKDVLFSPQRAVSDIIGWLRAMAAVARETDSIRNAIEGDRLLSEAEEDEVMADAPDWESKLVGDDVFQKYLVWKEETPEREQPAARSRLHQWAYFFTGWVREAEADKTFKERCKSALRDAENYWEYRRKRPESLKFSDDDDSTASSDAPPVVSIFGDPEEGCGRLLVNGDLLHFMRWPAELLYLLVSDARHSIAADRRSDVRYFLKALDRRMGRRSGRQEANLEIWNQWEKQWNDSDGFKKIYPGRATSLATLLGHKWEELSEPLKDALFDTVHARMTRVSSTYASICKDMPLEPLRQAVWKRMQDYVVRRNRDRYAPSRASISWSAARTEEGKGGFVGDASKPTATATDKADAPNRKDKTVTGGDNGDKQGDKLGEESKTASAAAQEGQSAADAEAEISETTVPPKPAAEARSNAGAGAGAAGAGAGAAGAGAGAAGAGADSEGLPAVDEKQQSAQPTVVQESVGKEADGVEEGHTETEKTQRRGTKRGRNAADTQPEPAPRRSKRIRSGRS